MFELCLCLRSASGHAGENFENTLVPMMISHCLTLSWVLGNKDEHHTQLKLFDFPFVFKEKLSSLHFAFMLRHWCDQVMLSSKVMC